MSQEVIHGIKVIRLNSSRIDEPDDPSYPFKLEAILRPPESMVMAFIGLCGGREELVVRALTKGAMDEFLVANDFRKHPRLRHLTITGPNGVIEDIEK